MSLKPYRGTFHDYAEAVVQFGYVNLFSVVSTYCTCVNVYVYVYVCVYVYSKYMYLHVFVYVLCVRE